MKIFTPTKEKIIATIVVYVGLLTGSIVRVGFYSIMLPGIFFSKSANLTPQTLSSSTFMDLLIAIIGNAIEVLFVYVAICFVIERFGKIHRKTV